MITNTMKRLFILALAAFALASCSDIQSIYDNDADNLMTFRAVTGVATKAPVSGTVFPNRDIQVAAYYNDANGGTSQNYFPFTPFTCSSWTSNNSPENIWGCTNRFWPFQGDLSMVAFSTESASSAYALAYTDNDNYSKGFSYTMDIAANSDDLLVGGKKSVTKTTNALSFVHAKSWIAFRAKASAAYNSTNNTGITITGLTLKTPFTTGKMTATMGATAIEKANIAWSELGGASDLTSGAIVKQLGADFQDLGWDVLLPAQAAVDIVITYTMHNGKIGDADNNITGMTYKYTHTPATNWTVGNKYSYDITMTLDYITVTASVVDWTSSTTAVTVPPVTP